MVINSQINAFFWNEMGAFLKIICSPRTKFRSIYSGVVRINMFFVDDYCNDISTIEESKFETSSKKGLGTCRESRIKNIKLFNGVSIHSWFVTFTFNCFFLWGIVVLDSISLYNVVIVCRTTHNSMCTFSSLLFFFNSHW